MSMFAKRINFKAKSIKSGALVVIQNIYQNTHIHTRTLIVK